jgi:hypothetical protein
MTVSEALIQYTRSEIELDKNRLNDFRITSQHKTSIFLITSEIARLAVNVLGIKCVLFSHNFYSEYYLPDKYIIHVVSFAGDEHINARRFSCRRKVSVICVRF